MRTNFEQLPPRAREHARALSAAIDNENFSRNDIDVLIARALADLLEPEAVAEGRADAKSPAAASATDHGWGKHIAAANARLVGLAR